MQIAKSQNGDRIFAEPGLSAFCPSCDAPVIAKCGEIKIWHWSHESTAECDPWSEGESAWHVKWKNLVLPGAREIVIGRHRADIVGNKGIVVELQNSAISPEEIRERESFYKRMIWVVNAEGFKDNFHLRKNQDADDDYRSFRWRWPRRSLMAITKPLLFDGLWPDDRVFQVKKIYDNLPCGGWGKTGYIHEFIEQVLSEVINPEFFNLDGELGEIDPI